MNRTEPWLAETAITLIDAYLKPEYTVFEFGSGSSTAWFIKKCCYVVSIEHDRQWFEKTVLEMADKFSKSEKKFELNFAQRPYNTAIDDFHDNSFDLVLVDGRDRVKCVISSIPKLKPGGWLVLDNSERDYYLPAINLMKNWNQVHCLQKQPDKYDFTYPNWTTSIFIKPTV